MKLFSYMFLTLNNGDQTKYKPKHHEAEQKQKNIILKMKINNIARVATID